MTEVVVGSSYERTLDVFRRFRDNVLLSRLGRAGSIATEVYYKLGGVLVPYVRRHSFLRRILLLLYGLLYKAVIALRREGLF